jgi:hypothetical protein
MLCKIENPANGRTRLASLPKSEKDLNAFLMDVRVGRENNYAYEISEIKTGYDALDKHIAAARPDIDELNHIAEYLRDSRAARIEKLGVVMEAQKPQNAADFINMMHNSGDYSVYENISDMEELGKEAAFRLFDFGEDSPVGAYADYKGFGENFHKAHGGAFAGGKYIVPPPEPKQVYDGVMLPGTEKLNRGALVSLFLVSRTEMEKLNEGEIAEPRGIWAQLPTTEYALDRAANRLGEASAGDCHIFHADSRLEIFMNEPCMNPDESPYKINALAEILSGYTNPAEMKKFEAVLEFEGKNIKSYSEIIEAAANLDCYDHDPEITSADDFEHSDYGGSFAEEKSLIGCCGEELLELRGGKITGLGCVARNGKSMTLRFEPPAPERAAGMKLGGM